MIDRQSVFQHEFVMTEMPLDGIVALVPLDELNGVDVQMVINEYRRFLLLTTKSNFSKTHSRLVDLVWHAHILESERYMKDCDQRIWEVCQEAATVHEASFVKTLQLYAQTFGERPDERTWMVRGESGPCRDDDVVAGIIVNGNVVDIAEMPQNVVLDEYIF